MKETLVVYHSRTGYTRRIAEALARRRGADLEEIRLLRDRRGALGYLRCALEAHGRYAPRILPPRHDPRGYRLVVVGTPIWVWNLSSPVRSYLRAHRRELRRIAFFCTMGGAGADNAFRDMAKLSGKAPVATLALTDREIDAHRHRGKLTAFAKALA
jgi:hypothetical protein